MSLARNGIRLAILTLSLAAAAQGQCIPGGLAVVVNKSNPIESISIGQLRKFILGDVRAWPDHKAAILIAREPSSKVHQCMLSTVVRLSIGEYQRYIINAEFRGEDPMTVHTVDSDLAAIKLVSRSPGSFAVVAADSLAIPSSAVKVVRLEVRPG